MEPANDLPGQPTSEITSKVTSPRSARGRLAIRGTAFGSAALAALGLYGYLSAVPVPTAKVDLFRASYRACEGFVEEQLAAPATATFAGRFSKATKINVRPMDLGHVGDAGNWVNQDAHHYTVLSYVDSQNMTGAEARQWFLCGTIWGLDPINGRREWMADGVAVYPWTQGTPFLDGDKIAGWVRGMTPEELTETDGKDEPTKTTDAEDQSKATAIDLAKHSHALEFKEYDLLASLPPGTRTIQTRPGDPILTNVEHAIQNELAHMPGELHVTGWEAKKIDDQTYLVSYTFEQEARQRHGWCFEVNLAAGVVRNVLADEALRKKYGWTGGN